MNDLPDSYIIIVEMKDSSYKRITKALNVREAREKLEIVHINIKNRMLPDVVNAFMFNLKEKNIGL